MKKIFFVISLLLIYFLQQISVTEASSARYISIASSTTEILFALGLDEEIIGVSSYCDYPPRAKTKIKVGTFSSPNIEKILSLKPDIVFSTGLQQAHIVSKLRQLNLKVFVSDPANFKELFESIRDIGNLVHKENEADALIRKMKAEINEVKLDVDAVFSGKRPKVFLEIWNDPLTTAGKGSFIDEILTLAGGVNIAWDTKKPYSSFSSEEVIRRNPDCIIIGYMQKEISGKIERRFGWENISAVKNKHIYNDISSELFLRPGPRLTEGLKEIHKRLHICLVANDRVK